MASSSSNSSLVDSLPIKFVVSSDYWYLPKKTLSEVPPEVFEKLENAPGSRTSQTLLKTLAPCSLQLWCSVGGDAGVATKSLDWWQPEDVKKCSPDLTKLLLFDHRRKILEAMKTSDVVIVIATTGTGKSLIGPAVLADMLRADVESEKKSYSRRGLSICPSSDHAANTAKMAEKLYMTRENAYVEIANFVNHFEQSEVMLDEELRSEWLQSREVLNSAMHAIGTYKGGLMALQRDAQVNLKLLHIDEAHSTRTELRDLLALSRRQLHAQKVEKLLLTSATLEDGEIDLLKRYFAEANLSLGVVDLSQEIPTTNRLTMSCVERIVHRTPEGFTTTTLSQRISADFRMGKAHQPSEYEADVLEFFDQEAENSGIEPEMNDVLPWFKTAIDRAMERATELMEERGDKRMPSILVLIPGKEHADRIRSSLENTYLDSKGGLKYPYKFFMFKDSGKPAFLVERLKSTARKQKVAGGMSLRSEEELDDSIRLITLTEKSTKEVKVNKWKKKMAELRDPSGPGFEKGKIILATPNISEGLTLEDVVIVVDAGVSRISGEYLRNGLRFLELTWIDSRQMYQRAGRCGRTCEGEYFLCVSDWYVDNNIRRWDMNDKLLVANFDELSWIRSVQLRVIDELIWTPPSKLTDEFKKSCMIRGLCTEKGFTREANQLYTYFPFLTPDIARFVVMGVRLGLAAHTICYVAEMMSSHKLCGRPTKIRENYNAIADSQAYDTYVNVLALSTWRNEEEIRPYCMGDSVCKADMVVTWLRHTFPPIVKSRQPKIKPNRSISNDQSPPPLPELDIELEPDYDVFDTYDDDKWKQLEQLADEAPDGFFWAGNWCTGKGEKHRDEVLGMKKLQQVFIRKEGRESVCMNVSQLTRACQRLDIIFPKDRIDSKDKGSIFAPRFNRYLRGENNYNLNDDGRALFRALLTMSSDKMASNYSMVWMSKEGIVHSAHFFEIHSALGSSDSYYKLSPERYDWKAREIKCDAAKVESAKAKPEATKAVEGKEEKAPAKSTKSKATTRFARYWNAFRATHANYFQGCLDPITVMQSVFFINAFGHVTLEGDAISIWLNASPKEIRNGITIRMDDEVKRRVSTARSSLLRVSTRIVTEHTPNVREFDGFAKEIITLWKALDDGTEASIQIQEEWKEKTKDLALYDPQKRTPEWLINKEIMMEDCDYILSLLSPVD